MIRRRSGAGRSRTSRSRTSTRIWSGRGVRRAGTKRTGPKRSPSVRRQTSPGTPRRVTRAEAQSRRSRALVVIACAFSALVLVSSFPLSSLVDQRGQLASAQAQAHLLTAENGSLSAEANRLNDPATIAAIARADYGFVEPGQKAYDILPTPGAPLTGSVESGHVPLEIPPVAPGSAESEVLLDTGAASDAASGAASGIADTASGASSPGPQGSGATGSSVWDRIAHSLEFWR